MKRKDETIPGLAEWMEAPFDVEPPLEILTPDLPPRSRRIIRQPEALDAARILDQSLTLAAVCGLDQESLEKFQGILHHWREIAVGEMTRRIRKEDDQEGA